MGAILLEVADGPGPRFPAILDAPYALVLWTYYQLVERERIRELRQRFLLQHEASLMAMAVNKPELLRDEHESLVSEARQDPRTRARDRAALLARGLALAARIEATGVLED